MVQLTPLSSDELDRALAVFAAGVADDPLAAAGFTAIRASRGAVLDEEALLAAISDLCARFGIAMIDEEPARAFSWDGLALRIRSEPCVLFHEIAHWQLTPAVRRGLPDFGLGAGPETGRKAEADAARAIDEPSRIDEECAASILGILWEAASGGPALEAFLEQNWLERFAADGTHRLFAATLHDLRRRGLIDGSAVPVPPHAPECPPHAHRRVSSRPSVAMDIPGNFPLGTAL